MLKMLRLILVVMSATFLNVANATAQNVGVVQSEILSLDAERLFAETQMGQRLSEEIQAKREQLVSRNQEIQAVLELEEKQLTDLRTETSPEEFRQMADAFDAKVQEIRRDSERQILDLERERERAPVFFMKTVEPVLVSLMREAGGVVVLNNRSILLRVDVIDITDIAISRIDREFGDGLVESPAGKDDVPNETSDE